eukprot:scaffold83939_cov14-Tisochrysis_lutea.AAC.1
MGARYHGTNRAYQDAAGDQEHGRDVKSLIVGYSHRLQVTEAQGIQSKQLTASLTRTKSLAALPGSRVRTCSEGPNLAIWGGGASQKTYFSLPGLALPKTLHAV